MEEGVKMSWKVSSLSNGIQAGFDLKAAISVVRPAEVLVTT